MKTCIDEYCKALQWDSKNSIYLESQCNNKTSGIYCDFCKDKYINSYIYYKSLSYDINTYPIVKIDAKWDIKIIDTEEYYRSTLQLLVPKLKEVIDLRKEHSRVFFTFSSEERHNKIIKRYNVILGLLTPYYKKWKEIIKSRIQPCKPLVIETQTPFPYSIPSVDETIEQKRIKELEIEERNKLKVQWKKEYLEELHEREQIINKEKELKIKKQQEVPKEYFTSDIDNNIDPLLTINGKFVLLKTIKYELYTEEKFNKNLLSLPIIQKLQDSIYSIIKLFTNIHVDDENKGIKIYGYEHYTDFLVYSIASVYKEQIGIDIIKHKNSSTKFKAKLESVTNIIRQSLVNIIKLTNGLDLTPLEEQLKLIKGIKIPNKYSVIHNIVADSIILMAEYSPYLLTSYNSNISPTNAKSENNKYSFNQYQRKQKLYSKQNECFVKFISISGEFNELVATFSDGKENPKYYEYKFPREVNKDIIDKFIPRLNLIKKQLNIDIKELSLIAKRAFVYYEDQSYPIKVEGILENYNRDSEELWKAFLDFLLFERETFNNISIYMKMDTHLKITIFINTIDYLLYKGCITE